MVRVKTRETVSDAGQIGQKQLVCLTDLDPRQG